MKNVIKTLFLAVFVTAFFSACQKDTVEVETSVQPEISLKSTGQASFGTPQPTPPTSFEGIIPDNYSGNFVASDDDQVCYELAELGYIGDVTGEMRGGKVNIPGVNDDANINIALSSDGRFLAWATGENVSTLAFIIKGGPNYHVYDYVGTNLSSDSWLASPLQRKNIPAVSHYNFCYTVTPVDFEGCTPGYWRNHADRWVGVATTDIFSTVFGVGPDVSLGAVISAPQTYGTDYFHAVAALLNAHAAVLGSNGQFVEYPYTVEQVLAKVLAGEFSDLKAANELGCPLSGSSAVKV